MFIESTGNPVNHTGKIVLAKLELMRFNLVPKVPGKYFQTNHSISSLGIEIGFLGTNYWSQRKQTVSVRCNRSLHCEQEQTTQWLIRFL